MKVLAFLQNQWFHDPEKVRAMIARQPAVRRRLIHYALFAGCMTGRILKAGLGEDWCRKIVWEEASPEIGGEASSVFPADPVHILKVIDEVKPTAIFLLGKVASEGYLKCRADVLTRFPGGMTIIVGPHPTARSGPDPFLCLREIRAELDRLESR